MVLGPLGHDYPYAQVIPWYVERIGAAHPLQTVQLTLGRRPRSRPWHSTERRRGGRHRGHV